MSQIKLEVSAHPRPRTARVRYSQGVAEGQVTVVPMREGHCQLTFAYKKERTHTPRRSLFFDGHMWECIKEHVYTAR